MCEADFLTASPNVGYRWRGGSSVEMAGALVYLVDLSTGGATITSPTPKSPLLHYL